MLYEVITFGNRGGIAAAEHDHARLRQALAQVVHQMRDARVAAVMLTEIRKFHRWCRMLVTKSHR